MEFEVIIIGTRFDETDQVGAIWRDEVSLNRQLFRNAPSMG